MDTITDTPAGAPMPAPDGASEGEVILRGPHEQISIGGDDGSGTPAAGGVGVPAGTPMDYRNQLDAHFAEHPTAEADLHRTMGTANREALAQVLHDTQQFFERYATAPMRALLEETGLGNDPRAIGFVRTMREEMGRLERDNAGLRQQLAGRARGDTPQPDAQMEALEKIEQARAQLRQGTIRQDEFRTIQERYGPRAYGGGLPH